MKTHRNKDLVSDSKQSFTEVLKDLSLKFIVYIFLTSIVFIASKAFWWAGFILFLIFAVYILAEFVTYAFLVTIAIFAVFLSATRYSKLNSKSQKDILQKGDNLFLISLFYGVFCLFLLLLTGSLFVLLFQDSFANI